MSGGDDLKEKGLEALFDMLAVYQSRDRYANVPRASSPTLTTISASSSSESGGGGGGENRVKEEEDPDALPSLFEMLAGARRTQGGVRAREPDSVRTVEKTAAATAATAATITATVTTSPIPSPSPSSSLPSASQREIVVAEDAETNTKTKTVASSTATATATIAGAKADSDSTLAPVSSASPSPSASKEPAAAAAAAAVLPDTSNMHAEIVRRKEECKREIFEMEVQLEALNAKIAAEHERLGLGDQFAQSQKRQVLAEATAIFEGSGKKGVAFLRNNGYFDQGGTPAEVAEFLFEEGQKDLNKTQIGEVLGEHKEENLAIMKAFCALHEFAGLDFDAALRAFLWSFRLPGESQKIDRLMEAFAKRYCTCNHDLFRSPDGCYVLAFATIMLNTSLHNPAVTKKTSLDEFVGMNRGIDAGQDVPRDLLEGLYNSIKRTPFKQPGDLLDGGGLETMFYHSEKEGWVIKEGGSNKTWKRRWLVLKGGCIYYFKHREDDHPCGIIPLDGVVVNLVSDASVPRSRLRKATQKRGGLMVCSHFELVGEDDGMGGHKPIKGCKTNSKGVVVQGNHTRYLFRADAAGGGEGGSQTAENEARQWASAIQTAITGMHFDDLRQRRLNSGGTDEGA